MLSQIAQARPCSLVPVFIDAAERKPLMADLKREL